MSSKSLKCNDMPWKKDSNGGDFKHIASKNPQMYIMKLAPGEIIAHHSHSTTKYNFILKGSMSDEDGEYTQGDLVINEKGTSHSVQAGSHGTEFLVIWND